MTWNREELKRLYNLGRSAIQPGHKWRDEQTLIILKVNFYYRCGLLLHSYYYSLHLLFNYYYDSITCIIVKWVWAELGSGGAYRRRVCQQKGAGVYADARNYIVRTQRAANLSRRWRSNNNNNKTVLAICSLWVVEMERQFYVPVSVTETGNVPPPSCHAV